MLHRATPFYRSQAVSCGAVALGTAVATATTGATPDQMTLGVILLPLLGIGLLGYLLWRMRPRAPVPDGEPVATLARSVTHAVLLTAFTLVIVLPALAHQGTLWLLAAAFAVLAVVAGAMALRLRAWERAHPGRETVVETLWAPRTVLHREAAQARS